MMLPGSPDWLGRVDDAVFIHHCYWWMGKAPSTLRECSMTLADLPLGPLVDSLQPSSPDEIRERSSHRLTHAPDCMRATGSTQMAWVGLMTLFSSTTANGGWVKRHPPYGKAI